MLNIVTVQTGNYCGRGAEYVRRLFDDVERHIGDMAYRSWCLTDDPEYLPIASRLKPEEGVTGWWHKLELFKPGIFEGQVLYFDLDQLILGSIKDLAGYRGNFAILHDPYQPQHHSSAIMSWKAGFLDHVWETWDRAGRPQFDPAGDQKWIETMQPKADFWQDMFPGQVLSYKRHIQPINYVPEETRIVIFHGVPKPHEMNFSLEGLTNGNLHR